MAIQQVRINLGFTADTSQATAQIQKLQAQLNSITSLKVIKNKSLTQLTPDIQQAITAAGELSAKLQSAFNVNTGKLDLTTFSNSLRRSNTTLTQYAQQLNALGPTGRATFKNLASSIIQAETPLVRFGKKLSALGVTLKNTIKWQLSSMMLHGFLNSISQAYNYAKDLNESLNSIRIVTGMSADYMANFAKQANKAAKELSTSTIQYTKSALIFYQQGLKGKDVTERAEVVNKLASVTGESAENISNYMTAIWNNFYDGSKSLEYYADVITALGAATASSSKEIAEGLEKFIAVAETAGLSYEYATAALATVTAETRQSADVIGTAFKTIFARLQGLSLGETLDDGTSLNKYSKALEAVGVKVKDQNGDLKSTNVILDELGAKWDTLSQNQQIAFAQTAGGMRQYSQLIALLKNWDKVKLNVTLGSNSTGELNEQFGIYEQSWKAASQRMLASSQKVWEQFMDDDFFIGLLDGLSKVMDKVGTFIESLGGLKGLFLTIGAIATRVFHVQIAKGIQQAAAGLYSLTPWGKRAEENLKMEALTTLKSQRSLAGGQTGIAENKSINNEVEMQKILMQNQKRMNDQELEELKTQMDICRQLDERAIKMAKIADKQQKELEQMQDMARINNQLGARQSVNEDAKKQLWNIAKGRSSTFLGATVSKGQQETIVRAQDNFVRQKLNLSNGATVTDDQRQDVRTRFAEELRTALLQAVEQSGGPLGDVLRNKIQEAMTQANTEVQKINTQLDTAAKAQVHGESLYKTGQSYASGPQMSELNETGRTQVYDTLTMKMQNAINAAKQLQTTMGATQSKEMGLSDDITELERLQQELKEAGTDAEKLQKVINGLNNVSAGSGEIGKRIVSSAKSYGEQTASTAQQTHGSANVNFANNYQQSVNAESSTVDAQDRSADAERAVGTFGKKVEQTGMTTGHWAHQITTASSAIMSLGATISSVQGAIDTFNNPDASGWDKVRALIGVLAAGLPVITILFSGFGKTALTAGTQAGVGMTAAMGPIGWILLAVTALIALFILLGDAAYKASPKGQFEAAAKAAEKATEAAEQAKSAYENLISTLEGIDNGINAIQSLTEGTLEWRQAIVESNSALIDLLASQDMLNSENFTVDEDGLMHLTPEARREMIQNQMDQVEQTTNAKYLADINKNEKANRVKASSKDFSSQLTLYRSNGDTTYDALGENDNLTADVGMAVADALASGRINSGDLTDVGKITEILKEVTGLYGTEAESLAKQIAASDELIASFSKLGAEVSATASSARVMKNEMAKTEFDSQIKSMGLDKTQTEHYTTFLADNLDKKTQELYDEKWADTRETGKGSGLTDEEIQKEYAKAMGYDVDKTENLSGNKAKYYDKEGNEIELDDETARKYLAQKEAAEAMRSTMSTYMTLFNDFATSLGQDSNSALGQALTSFMGGQGGDLSNLTAKEIGDLSNSISYDEETSTFKLGDTEIDDEAAISAGYDNAKAMYDAFVNDTTEFANVLQEEIDKVDTELKDSTDNMTLNQVQTLNKVYGNLDEESKKQFAETFNDLSEDNKKEFLDATNDFDWKQANAKEKYLEALEKEGIITSENEQYFNQLAEQLEEIKSNVPTSELGDFIDKLSNLRKSLKDLKIGDVVSPELMALMEENGYQIEDYAIKVDGNYVLVKEVDTTSKGQIAYTSAENAQNAYEDLVREDEEGAWQNAKTKESVDFFDYVIQKGVDGDSTVETFKNVIGELSEQTIQAIFNKSKEEMLNAEYTDEDLKENFGKIQTVITEGNAGTYEQQMHDSAVSNMVNAGALGMESMEGFYQTSYVHTDPNDASQVMAVQTMTKEASDAMQVIASQTEEGQALLFDYQQEIEGVKEGTKEWYAANQKLADGLKKIEINKATKNAQELIKDLDTLSKFDKNLRFKQLAQELSKVFGTKITDEYISNNRRLVEQFLNGATEMERGIAAQKISFDTASSENLTADETEMAKTVGVNLDSTNFQAALDELQGQELKPIVLRCIGSGDFSALINEATFAEGSLEQMKTDLATIGATNLSPEGFAQLAEALSAFQKAVDAIDRNSPEADALLEKAKNQLNQDISAVFKGDAPNVAPDVTPTGGGGNSKSAKDRISEGYQKAIDKEKKKIQDQREGLDPLSAAKYYDKEIELLEKENKLLEKQMKIKKDMLKQAAEEFNAKDLGYKLEISDDGTISNMAEIMAEISLKYDKMASTEGKARAEEEFKTLLAEFESVQEIEGDLTSLQELFKSNEKAQAELELEKITKAIDWKVQLIDWEIEKLNYYQEKLLNQAHGNKQEIEAMLEGFAYQEQEMLQLFEKSKVLQNGINELVAARNKHPGYEQMFNEAILDYQGDLLAVNQDIIALRNEIEELVQNVLDRALNELSTQIGRLDTYSSMLQNFSNIIDLSGRSILDAGLKSKIAGINIKVLTEKMSNLREEMIGIAEATSTAQAAYEDRVANKDEQSVKFWENQLDILEQQLETSQSDFLASWEEVLNTASELFEAQVESIVNVLDNALSPFSSLESFQTAYDQAKERQEQYLDDEKKLYELNKLNRQLNSQIADENDLLSKQKLKSIQEDIYALQRSGVEMSEYDLEILQKKYDLQLAEIALLEAQNSKTSMRLVRDAAGNWNYVYDADEKKIEEAAQVYEDALYELNQVSKEYLDEISESLLTNQTEYTEALMELDKTAADYEIQLLNLQEHYSQRQYYLLSELNKGVVNSGMTFHDTLYGQLADLYDYEEAYNNFISNSEKSIAELMLNYKDWQQVVSNTMGVAGTSWDTFSQDMDGTLMTLEDHVEKLCEKIEELVDVLMSYLNSSVSMVAQWQAKYSQAVQSMLSSNESVINQQLVNQNYVHEPEQPGGFGDGSGISALLGNNYIVPIDEELYAAAYNAKDGWCAKWVADVREAVGDSVLRAESASKMVEQGQAYKYGGQNLEPGTVVIAHDPNGFGHAMIVGLNGNLYGTASTASNLAITSLDQYPFGSLYYIPPTSSLTGWKAGLMAQSIYAQRERQAAAYDTGGYTGNWNSKEGRMAILHEKELILNKDDTSNMLDALSILRDLNFSSIIDNQVASMIGWTNENLNALINQARLPEVKDQKIEQTVEIIAEFPNVIDSYEIQDALGNLSNSASQYLNIK